jgi:F-type H+-transporting ATPase subunit b
MEKLIRQGFGFNTNLFETNILNLAVVLGIVVTFVGEALSTLLDQRRRIILATIQEADQKAAKVQQQLEEARKSVEISRLRAREIAIQTNKTIEQEEISIRKQLEEDLRRLQETRDQRLRLERQRVVQATAQKVADIAINIVETNLRATFSSQGTGRLKQKELNDIHVEKTLQHLKV